MTSIQAYLRSTAREYQLHADTETKTVPVRPWYCCVTPVAVILIIVLDSGQISCFSMSINTKITNVSLKRVMSMSTQIHDPLVQ